MDSKTCTKCLIEKPLNEFSSQKKGLYGRRSICRVCVRIRFNLWYSVKAASDPTWKAHRNEISANWAKRNPLARSEIALRRNKKELQSSPEKVKVRALVNQRVRFGRMPKASTLSCSMCGGLAQHYHHHKGYAFENRYDVVPVCAKCHVQLD